MDLCTSTYSWIRALARTRALACTRGLMQKHALMDLCTSTYSWTRVLVRTREHLHTHSWICAQARIHKDEY